MTGHETLGPIRTGKAALDNTRGGYSSRKRSRVLAGIVAISVLLMAASASGQELHVMVSGAFTQPFNELTPQFEKQTSNKVAAAYGASMGSTPEAIPNRLNRGEPADLVILADYALDDLIKAGKVIPSSRTDLVHSSIGMAVKSGAPKPDISTVEALKRTLLEASSIAYSDSASGVYIANVMLKNLGVADQVSSKSKRVQGERVAAVVARGEAQLGFQQISELLPVPGVDFVGPLPAGAQQVTTFSAGIPTTAAHPEAARALIKYFTSPAAVAVIKKNGLEPASH